MADVVAVADVGEGPPDDRTERLLHRHHVGERLAGVVVVGQGVHHGDRGVRGQLLDPLVVEGADGQRGQVAREHLRRVGDGLTPTELQLVGTQRDRKHAERPGGRLEADPGPRRRLVEDHPDLAAGQAPAEGRRLALLAMGQVEHCPEGRRIERVDGQEVAGDRGARDVDPGEMVGGGHGGQPAVTGRRAASTIGSRRASRRAPAISSSS